MIANCQIIDGKSIAESKKQELSVFFNAHKASLLTIWIGSSKVTESFVNIKKSFARDMGVEFEILKKDKANKDELVSIIKKTNANHDAVIVQLPMEGIDKRDEGEILSHIGILKDVDVLSASAYEIFKNTKANELKNIAVPPVARAVWTIIKQYNIDLSNLNITILGKGKLVGRPVFDLLAKFEYSSLRSFDKNDKKEYIINALAHSDLIVSGIGNPNFIKKEYIKRGAILIDAGTSTQNNQLFGDISLECVDKASLFAKTPGGIGPLTVASIFENLKILVEKANCKKNMML